MKPKLSDPQVYRRCKAEGVKAYFLVCRTPGNAADSAKSGIPKGYEFCAFKTIG
jgi:hypothetical protein